MFNKTLKVTVDGKKYNKTNEELKKLIEELFLSKGETLTEDELERAVKAYIYLTDDRIPVSAAVVRKRSK